MESYDNIQKLEIYEEKKETVFNKHFRDYTFNKIQPSVKNLIIYDIACGIGNDVFRFIQMGAKQFIGMDIMPLQINYAKQKQKQLKINENQLQLYVGDAKNPIQISQYLCDLITSFHVFCFAQNYQDLINMAKHMYINLNVEGKVISYSCSDIYQLQQYQEAFFQKQDDQILKYNLSNDLKIPGYLQTIENGFTLPRYLWKSHVIMDALKEVGFNKVYKVMFEMDPEQYNQYQLQNIADFCYIVAEK